MRSMSQIKTTMRLAVCRVFLEGEVTNLTIVFFFLAVTMLGCWKENFKVFKALEKI